MNMGPSFRHLSESECRDLLARNVVGRLAFMKERTVDIEPLGYVFDGDWLFMRSAHGTKIEALAHVPYVAFEVDEVEGMFDWRSVVAYGTCYVLSDAATPAELDSLNRAIKALRSALPEALTESDPVPARDVVYGFHIDSLTGRAANSGPAMLPRPRTERRKK